MTLSNDLTEFVKWTDQHIEGDEKGEAQVFVDRLFKAFGLGGVHEAGGKLEARIRRKGKAISFADYMWKPVVLIEMKKRGEPLKKHQAQAFDYWIDAVPHRPRWVVLCNFDEFWVYDFDTQIHDPMDIVTLKDLPRRHGALAFLQPDNPAPHVQARHRGRHPQGRRPARPVLQQPDPPRRRPSDRPALHPAVARRPLLGGHRPAP